MDLSILSVFLGCAALGGLVLLVQTIMLLFGHDDGGDGLADILHQPCLQEAEGGVSLTSMPARRLPLPLEI
jgi:hypothetical protein